MLAQDRDVTVSRVLYPILRFLYPAKMLSGSGANVTNCYAGVIGR